MQKYTSTLKSRPYFYLELKKTSMLKLKGFNYNEIKQKLIDENVFLVKVNYEKFQEIEVPQGEGMKPFKTDLLTKI